VVYAILHQKLVEGQVFTPAEKKTDNGKKKLAKKKKSIQRRRITGDFLSGLVGKGKRKSTAWRPRKAKTQRKEAEIEKKKKKIKPTNQAYKTSRILGP